MLGKRGATAEVVPYFWSDLADWAKLEYVGLETGTPVIRGSMDDGDFTAFYLADDGRAGGSGDGRPPRGADARAPADSHDERRRTGRCWRTWTAT